METEMRTIEGVMTEQEISAREERRLELQREFSYDGYLVIRKELYANLRDPAVTVRDGNITFNTACIDSLTGAVYVRLYFNEELGRLAVRVVNENDKDALRWCVVKGDKRKSRKVNCPDFRYMRPTPPFIQDSLLCECAYVVNLDEQTLEFYVGMQTEPQEGNRYGAEGRPCATGELFYPCRLLATFSLEQVRAEDTAALSDTMRRLTKEYKAGR